MGNPRPRARLGAALLAGTALALARAATHGPAALDGPGLGRLVRSSSVARWMANRSPVEHLLIPTRDVRIWLPPAYRTHPALEFPVLYVHDGQNAVYDADSWTGHSWRLTAQLSAMGLPPEHQPIVVLIDNTGRRRHLEYSDSPVGDAYLEFLCDGLKPRVDRCFRTRSGAAHTAAMGASLGGLCAFRSMWLRPDSIGNCAALSPVFQPPLLLDVAMNGRRLHGVPGGRVYIDNGGDTDARRVPLLDLSDGPNPGYWWLDSQLQPGVGAMKAALDLHGVAHMYHRAPGARHNERGWAARIRLPLEHLLRQQPPSARARAPSEPGLAPRGAEGDGADGAPVARSTQAEAAAAAAGPAPRPRLRQVRGHGTVVARRSATPGTASAATGPRSPPSSRRAAQSPRASAQQEG